jgi:hypothetical protein
MADLIRYPTGVQYREALYDTGLAFRDSALRGGEPELDPLGMPKAISGNFASVFTISGTDGRRWAVKCFTRNVPDQAFRYQKVSKALDGIRSPWKVDFEFLTDGVLCQGARYPVLKMEWVEATGLLPYVEAHLTDQDALADLAGKFGDLVRDLSRNGIAHGDLQHGNILVMPSGELKLIDYDGMFVPELASVGASELGHPNYQSPLRTSSDWGPELDRFSSWVIYVSLSALALNPVLWRALHADGDETLLFHQGDFTDRDGSRARYALTNSSVLKLREIAKEIDFLWAPDLTAIPALEVALGAGAASTRTAGNASAARSAPTATGTDWLRQFGAEQGAPGGAAAVTANHSSARRTSPIGTAAWVTTHLPQSPRSDFARPTKARRVSFAVLGLVALVSVLATVVEPALTLLDIVLVAITWTVGFSAYRRTPERIERRQSGRAFRSWRKAAAKRSRAVADLEGGVRKLDRDAERGRVQVLKKVDRARADEQREMTDHDNWLTKEIDRLDREIRVQQVRADVEIVSALRVLQQTHMTERLHAARMSSATIHGIGPTLKMSLALAGITTAADFTDVGFAVSSNGGASAYLVRRDGTRVSPRGIGEKKARALNNWRLAVESDARATRPTGLPRARESAITDRYAQQKRSLENKKQVTRRQAAEQRETLRKKWAAKHMEVEQELNGVTARFAQLRAEKDTEIATARQHAETAIWRRDFAQRELDRYRSIRYRHYLRRLVRG